MDEAHRFLGRLLDEFPGGVSDGEPLPAEPPSLRVREGELQGESLEVGLRLLTDRAAPPGLAPLLCQAAFVRLLKHDLSPFHCPRDDEQEEEAEPLLQSQNVQRLFINELLQVAQSWLQTPPTFPASPHAECRCSVHAIRNSRRKMEDKHVMLTDFNGLLGLQDGPPRSYFAVFDGHGGVDAAAFAATHLHVTLGRQEALQGDVEQAFKDAFKHTDDMFRDKARRERLRSGSTGVAVLLQASDVITAWVGDSQALLVRHGRVVRLMEPHKPERQDERRRIEDLGGCVTFMGCWRVNGTYAVSRAIGDFDQKPYVSGEADCSSTPLHGDEDFLLLACDGFFDAVKPEDVPRVVMEALEEEEEGGALAGGGASVAQRLVSHAKEGGSNDNITVMVVFLRPPEQLLTRTAPTQDSQDALQL